MCCGGCGGRERRGWQRRAREREKREREKREREKGRERESTPKFGLQKTFPFAGKSI